VTIATPDWSGRVDVVSSTQRGSADEASVITNDVYEKAILPECWSW
jgi:hypothetical protein